MAKAAFNKKKIPFYQQIGLKLRKNLIKCYIFSMVCVVLKLGRFGIRSEIPGNF